MKKRLLSAGILLAASLFGNSVFAQKFQPFRKGLTYHYISQDSVFSLRVDSVKVVAGDSVFVFNQTVKKPNGPVSGGTCTPPVGAVIYQTRKNYHFGNQVTKKTNGDYLFGTTQGQAFLLKTKGAVGQSWTFNAAQNITATLSAKAVEPVSTASDSVFTYTLSNGAEIKLSKNYGFAKAPNFASYADNSIKPKTLQFYALPEKGLGTAISDPFRIYDFQVGDKFTYYRESLNNFLGSTALCSETWRLIEVLNKRLSPNGDTIYYSLKIDQINRGHGFPGAPTGVCQAPQVTTNSTFNETLAITRNSPAYLRNTTNSFYTASGPVFNGKILESITKKAQYNFREQLHFSTLTYRPCSNTFEIIVDDPGHRINYGIGLGMTFEKYALDTETLIAYVKGTETYGRWQSVGQILATEKERNLKPMVTAFPNPFASELNLKFGEVTGNVQLSLVNALGQEIWNQETAAAANSEIRLALPEFAKGLYILKATQNGKTYTTRLVKE